MGMLSKKEWLEEKIMCDEWGRPPSLADVPLTIMTRKEALIKQGGNTKSISKLSHEPGKNWDYSDAGVAILSLLFFNIAKINIDEYLSEKILKPIGIENASWDLHGGGQYLGPYTSSHIGLHISSRDLSRFGFLLLNQGKWKHQQLIPSIH